MNPFSSPSPASLSWGAIGVLWLTLAPLRASPTSDAAWIAGIASIVGPTSVQAVSRSGVEVKVEVFRETIALEHRDRYGNMLYSEPGRQPFGLTSSLALQRQLEIAATLDDPVKFPNTPAMTTALESLQPAKEQLAVTRGRLDAFVKLLVKLAQDESNKPFAQVRDDAQLRLKAVDITLAAIDRFAEAVGAALADGSYSNEELNHSAQLLLAIRVNAINASRDISDVWLHLMESEMRGIVRAVATHESVAASEANPSDISVRFTELTNEPRKLPGETNIATLQRLVWLHVTWLRRLKANHYLVVDDKGKARASDAQKWETAKANFARLISQLGYYGSIDDVFAADRLENFRLVWSSQFIEAIVAEAADRTTKATYVGVSISANFGPIANEVIQGLLAENEFIDRIATESDRWVEFNSAYSRGSAGTHNAIIYFDNMLTPVLKSATFDPSQLLLANAQLYKRATSVVAQVYGAPTAADISGGGADASLNLMNLEARRRGAANSEAAKNKELVEALGALVDEHDKIVALQNSAHTDWADYRGAAKAELAKLADRLASRAVALEKP
jgi:hypothetical protein